MCGIGVALWSSPSPTALPERPAGSPKAAGTPKAAGIPKAVLRRRGPDAQAKVVVGELRTTGFELHLTAAVLHMRGDACRPQPLRSDAGDVLLWNGESVGGG
jgi:asparagine synthetase B (glutamine-hydrolysing)